MPSAEMLGPLYSQTAPAGLVRLQNHLLARFPGSHAGGLYNPTSSLSSGGPSPHRVTQALDLMCDEATARQVIRYMIKLADVVNLQQVIAWHEIITVQRWAAGIRYYSQPDHSGGNGHAHIHIGLHASRAFDPSWIQYTAPPAPPPPPPEPDQEGPTVYVEYDGQTHVFFKNEQTGQVGHAWPGGGWENMSLAYGFEALDPGPGQLEVHLSPAPGKPVIHVGGMARKGTRFLEYRFWGAWVAELYPKDR